MKRLVIHIRLTVEAAVVAVEPHVQDQFSSAYQPGMRLVNLESLVEMPTSTAAAGGPELGLRVRFIPDGRLSKLLTWSCHFHLGS